jgi:hypothetical protein
MNTTGGKRKSIKESAADAAARLGRGQRLPKTGLESLQLGILEGVASNVRHIDLTRPPGEDFTKVLTYK